MSAITKREQTAEVVSTDAASLLEVISRAASDPATDVDKLERLMGLYERITARQAEQAYVEAMNAAQEDMSPVSRDAANPQTKSRYASYEALDRALRPIYAKHGFSLSFDTADGAPEAHVRVVCKIAHSAGHSERPHLDMPADGKGAKGGDVMTKTHATMSAVSYAKRGLLKMVFNIAEGDDDGNAAGDTQNGVFVSDEQLQRLETMIDEVGADRQRFCAFLKVDSLASLPARRFDAAVKALEAKRAQNAKQEARQ